MTFEPLSPGLPTAAFGSTAVDGAGSVWIGMVSFTGEYGSLAPLDGPAAPPESELHGTMLPWSSMHCAPACAPATAPLPTPPPAPPVGMLGMSWFGDTLAGVVPPPPGWFKKLENADASPERLSDVPSG